MFASAALLTAISTELDDLRRHIDALAPVVAAGVVTAPTRFMTDAQRLDVMNQTLEAIAALTGDLAQGRDPDASIARMTLADLAQRLARASGSRGPDIARSVVDVELF